MCQRRALRSAVLVALIVATGLTAACRFCDSIEDDVLIQRWRDDRQQLDALASMFLEDGSIALLHASASMPMMKGTNWDDNPPSEARLERYRALMRELNINFCGSDGTCEVTCWIADGTGFPKNCEEKGFTRVCDPASLIGPIVETLDGRNPREGRAFRELEDGWYLAYSATGD